MPLIRWFLLLTLSLLLTACGGGGTITKDTGTDTLNQYTLTLSLVDKGGLPFSDTNPVSSTNPGTIQATLKRNGTPLGKQLVSFSTEFAGEIRPVSGIAETNDSGIATATLASGAVKGAGKLIATYTPAGENEVSANLTFTTIGDDAPTQSNAYQLTLKLLQNCNDGWDANRSAFKLDPTDPSTGCRIVNNLDSTVLTDVYIDLVSSQSQVGLANQIVTLETDLGSILPQSGRVLTDAFGVGLVKLQPDNSGGAGTISAKYDTAEGIVNFSFGTADLVLTIDNGLKTNSNGTVVPLKAGGSTIVSVTLKNKSGDLYTLPTDVQFASTCAAQNKAVLDATVKSSAGVATATYRASGCDIVDPVVVSVETGGRNFSGVTQIPVENAAVQSIRFVKADPEFIALPPGEGGVPTQSQVSFKLIDEDGNPVRQERIDFKFADSTGKAGLTQTSASTDNNGLVQTVVTSGVVPGPLVVEACHIPKAILSQLGENDDATCWQEFFDRCTDSDTSNNAGCPSGEIKLVPVAEQVSSVSSKLTLSSGVTDQNSFDASPTTFNTNSLNYNGVTTNISIYFGDQFNHLSGDGVVATVYAEAGVVGKIDGEQGTPTFECQTTDAVCNLTWRSQGERPFSASKWKNKISDVCDPYFGVAAPCIGGLPQTITEAGVTRKVIPAGRVSVLVTAKGQETFVDKPSSGGVTRTNGLFDEGEYFPAFDLPEAFNDYNEDGKFSSQDCGGSATTGPCSPAGSDGGHDEIFIDRNSNGVHDGADGKYNGLLCSAAALAANACTRELIDVRRQFELVMSGDVPFVRFAVSSSGNPSCSSVAGLVLESSNDAAYCDVKSVDLSLTGGTTGATVYVFFSDINNNPLPAGTEVSLSASNGDFEVTTLSDLVPNTNSRTTQYAVATITRESEGNSDFSGSLSIRFEVPSPVEGGEATTVSFGIPVLDDR
ncbi:Ig-like domain-containing protein [Pseudoalteromonas xiamenensis]